MDNRKVKGKRVLVIDDVEENVDIIDAKLTHIGYEVISAYDGETGVEKATVKRPDLILLDIMLPGMDGWAVLEKLKANPRTKNIPVIFMTAYTTIQFAGEKSRAIQNGAVDYLKKPFNLSEMVDLVEKHILLNQESTDASKT